MALENADGGSGDWISDDVYTELCEGQALALLKILRIEPRQPVPGSPNEWEPVIVDMLVLSGKYEGTVWRSERMTKAGLTNTLRMKWDPSAENMARKPKERVKIARTEGTDLACRFGFYKDKRSGLNRFGLNAARADDMKRVEELFKSTDDDPYKAAEDAERAASADVLGGGAGSVPASVGGGSDYDEEPPF